MNILYSVFATGWGGLEKYPLTLYNELKEKGHNIYVLTVEGTNLHKECIKRGIEVFTVPKIKKIDIATVKLMKKILKEKKIDVVHSNTSREAYNWRLTLIGHPEVRYYLTFHIGVPNHKELLHKILYKRVDKIIAICEYERGLMKERIPVPHEKLQLLYNGVKLDEFNLDNVKDIQFRKNNNIREDQFVFTAVGNLSSGKGILEFIDASKKIIDNNKEVVFNWIGGDDHIVEDYSLESLRADLDAGGYSDNIRLLGYQQNIPSILSETDVFVLPSHKESFGIVYIEAMSMELPVIGCSSGGVPEIVINGENGYLVEPKNSDELFRVLDKAVSNKDELKKIGEKNRGRVMEFSMDKHINNLIDIYSWRKNG